METEFGIRQYKHTGICTILGDRDKDTTVSSASSLCEGEKIVCKISLTGSLWKLLCATPLQGYQDICRMSCARDPVYIGSVRRELKNVTAWDSRWANKSNPTDIYQVKPNTPNSMLNKTLSSFLCVQGLIFLSTGAKRGAQRQHWNLGVRGLTTIQQGFDFIVHLRYEVDCGDLCDIFVPLRPSNHVLPSEFPPTTDFVHQSVPMSQLRNQ